MLQWPCIERPHVLNARARVRGNISSEHSAVTERLGQHMPSAPDATHVRCAVDGQAYTYAEFRTFYGDTCHDMWRRAGLGDATELPMQTRGYATERPEISLYLDYNDVLNTGRPDMLEALCEFLVKIDHLNRDIRICLLSKAKRPFRQRATLGELDRAGVLDLFDEIIFTTERTGFEHEGENATERRIFHGAEVAGIQGSVAVSYEVFYGGKDQYIHSHRSSEPILLVDDKAATLVATRTLVPWVTGLEMRKHRFYTDPQIYHHVRSLAELHATIATLTAPNWQPRLW